MAQAHAPEHHMTAAEQARHDAKIELEGERLVNAALDKRHPHAFHDELAQINPQERREALAAAKAYERQRERDGHGNSHLPTVEFFESNGKLGQVKVRDHGVRVAYDADKEPLVEEKSTAEKAKDMAVEKGKQAGAAVKGVFGHIRKH